MSDQLGCQQSHETRSGEPGIEVGCGVVAAAQRKRSPCRSWKPQLFSRLPETTPPALVQDIEKRRREKRQQGATQRAQVDAKDGGLGKHILIQVRSTSNRNGATKIQHGQMFLGQRDTAIV